MSPFPEGFKLGKELQYPIFLVAVETVIQELQDAIPNFSNEDAKKFFDSIYAKGGLYNNVRKTIVTIINGMAIEAEELYDNFIIKSQLVDLFRDSGIDVKFLAQL